MKSSLAQARLRDRRDPLRRMRSRFHVPPGAVYLCGNSLGLQPKTAAAYVQAELRHWARHGVEGHHLGPRPWVSYHELVTAQSARLVGAKPLEVVVMNTLTVNLHLMMVSFYRPTARRHKIILEKNAFPSDQYAAASQARFHGFDPARSVIHADDILDAIERHGDQTALVLVGNVNYLTGEAFDMKAIAAAARRKGCFVGFDLAHGVGNLEPALHDSGADFAVWCSYKYLNAGPGGLSGCFVHERHAHARGLPRFEGWWGTDKKRRFRMEPRFDPIHGAEAWQLSNPPILQLAALRASLEIFDEAGMPALRRKSAALTGYLEDLLRGLPSGLCDILTPARRGCQLSLRLREDRARLKKRLARAKVVCDFSDPDNVRVAPVPLYNGYEDVLRFVEALRG